MAKVKISKNVKETNQTKSLATFLDLLINQVFLVFVRFFI